MLALTFLGMIGAPQIILIIAVILLLFGGRKIPELMKGLGSGIKEFKKATKKSFKKLTDLEEFLKENPIKNKTILLKGSRGVGLEKIIQSL